MLELGGDDAMIVLADANLGRAARGGAWAAFANAGQSGGSVGRAVVMDEVHDRFLERLVAITGALRVGDPARPGTEIGPLVSTERLDRLTALVDDAREQGATVHCGGPVSPSGS